MECVLRMWNRKLVTVDFIVRRIQCISTDITGSQLSKNYKL